MCDFFGFTLRKVVFNYNNNCDTQTDFKITHNPIWSTYVRVWTTICILSDRNVEQRNNHVVYVNISHLKYSCRLYTQVCTTFLTTLCYSSVLQILKQYTLAYIWFCAYRCIWIHQITVVRWNKRASNLSSDQYCLSFFTQSSQFGWLTFGVCVMCSGRYCRIVYTLNNCFYVVTKNGNRSIGSECCSNWLCPYTLTYHNDHEPLFL